MFLDEVFFVFLLLGVGWTSRIVILSFSSIKIFFNCYFSKCILYPYLSFGDCSDIYVSFMHASVVSVLHSIDCSLPSSFVHGILQARVLEWVAMPSSRASSWPRELTYVSCVPCIAGGFFTHWATRVALDLANWRSAKVFLVDKGREKNWRGSNQSVLKEVNPEYSLKDWC